MKLLLVGPSSSLAMALKPLLAEFSEVWTAGRSGCDVFLDLAGPIDAISIASGFDVVINCGAHFGGRSAEDMIAAENVNVMGTMRLCQACTRAEVGRLVLVSSIFADLGPISPFYGQYSLSKRHADEVAQLYAETFGLRLLIIRPSQIYGVGEAYRKNQPFLYAIMDKAQNNQDIIIHGSNDALRNFIHVEDVAQAIALAVRGQLTGNFPCVYPENIRYSQIAEAAIAAFGSLSKVSFATEHPDIPDNAFPPGESLYRAIGYHPRISMAEGAQKEAAHRRRAEA